MLLKNWPKELVACLCCRVGDPYWNGMPGSVQQKCWNCEHPVWVSPATMKEFKVEKAAFLCLVCNKAYAEASGKATTMLPMSPAQIEERIQTGNHNAPLVGDVRKLPKPTRDQFIQSYVSVKVEAGFAEDTPELRESAGAVYDILTDDSPEGNAKFIEGLKQVCENLTKGETERKTEIT